MVTLRSQPPESWVTALSHHAPLFHTFKVTLPYCEFLVLRADQNNPNSFFSMSGKWPWSHLITQYPLHFSRQSPGWYSKHTPSRARKTFSSAESLHKPTDSVVSAGVVERSQISPVLLPRVMRGSCSSQGRPPTTQPWETSSTGCFHFVGRSFRHKRPTVRGRRGLGGG